jgi:hypothetical protein
LLKADRREPTQAGHRDPSQQCALLGIRTVNLSGRSGRDAAKGDRPHPIGRFSQDRTFAWDALNDQSWS